MKQDFNKKIAIVVDKNIDNWQVLNAVAHASAYIGNKLSDNFITGDYFETKDHVKHPRNSQFPIIVLSAKSGQLKKLVNEIRNSGLLYLGFIKDMIETNDDEEIVEALSKKLDSEIEYLGIGFFGDKEQVNRLTKKFSLWK